MFRRDSLAQEKGLHGVLAEANGRSGPRQPSSSGVRPGQAARPGARRILGESSRSFWWRPLWKRRAASPLGCPVPSCHRGQLSTVTQRRQSAECGRNKDGPLRRGGGRTGDPARTRGPGRVMWLDGQGPASQYHGPIDTLGPAPVPTLRGPPTTPRSAHPVASGLVLVLQPRLRCFPEVFPELASLRAWLVTGFPAWCAGGWVVAERGLECPGGTWAQRGSGLG